MSESVIHDQPASIPSYIPGLDALRAVSVLLVIAAHSGLHSVPGALGVTTFFFISGFLITNLLITEHAASSTIHIGRFYLRRYVRLMPEQATYVLIAVILQAVFFRPLDGIQVLGALFYFTNYLKAFAIHAAPPPDGSNPTPFTTGHYWSLAVEEHFYLLWPLVFAWCCVQGANRRRLVATLCSVVVGCLLIRMTVLASGSSPAYTYYASECRLDSLAFGCLGAVLLRYYPQLVQRVTRPWLLAIGLAILATPFVGRSFLDASVYFQDGARTTFQGFGFVLCFLYFYGRSWKSPLLRLLEWRPLRFIGVVSYGAYIWHFAVVNLITRSWGYARPEQLPMRLSVACALMTIPISVFLGFVSHRVVLEPFNGIRRQLGSHVAKGDSERGKASSPVNA
jgi:peptidoglycan/LPS O-acetylase OafA/YrhL